MRRRDLGDRAPLSKGAATAFSSQLRTAALLVLERGPLAASELAAELGCSDQAARDCLTALKRAGLVTEAGTEVVSGGARVKFRVARTGWAELVASIERFVDGK